MSHCNREYQQLLSQILAWGELVQTRNGETQSLIDAAPFLFFDTPLVTLRKTAWKMALREMEWFMSGDAKCPDELLPWWQGQLDSKNRYNSGYSEQFRHYGCGAQNFDQVAYVLNGLRNHPYSRRLILTTWNAYDMAHITELNDNLQTPSCCHNTLTQFFVRGDRELHVTTYQRSADVLLGLPHNFIQTWAMLLYFAHHTQLEPGTLRWLLGDAHLYQHPTHRQAAKEIVRADTSGGAVTFQYQYSGDTDEKGLPLFKASDFSIIGEIPQPIVTTQPVLLI